MNKKGITLVELLAVLVVIGLIAAIVVPNVFDDVKDKKLELKEYQISIIKEAAESYVADKIVENPDLFNTCNNTQYSASNQYNYGNLVKISDLISLGYLSETYSDFNSVYVQLKCYPAGNNIIYKYEVENR